MVIGYGDNMFCLACIIVVVFGYVRLLKSIKYLL